MFAAPPEQSLEWSDSAVEGSNRFLRRLWKSAYAHLQSGEVPTLDASKLSEEQQNLHRKTHESIKKVSDDFDRRLTFNTAIAAVMELNNEIGKLKDREGQGLAVEREAIEAAVLLLAPIVPHFSHTLWQALGHKEAAINVAWPSFDEQALVRSTIEMVIQINGKVRAKLQVAADASNDEVMALALAQENVQKFIDGKEIKMKKVIPGKLVTIAVK
jgi:leucyl-tRNA synthetase